MRGPPRFVDWAGPAANSFHICAASRRWGSHTGPGRVVLNRALIAARRDWIDHVIVHELCHVVEPLHSPTFFRLLGRLMPDWQSRKQALERAMA